MVTFTRQKKLPQHPYLSAKRYKSNFVPHNEQVTSSSYQSNLM
ncbi:7784_t:CDS:2 [Funneliformis caledonium]|uniref:7784_t:CDS:1 n=1 Tax=Funneliformis caledonium TaxID=1117310 RepID=A0A9N9EAW9_9GLOM|nr:7784_t:CDS:2 [Funneliformis caledonium]